MNSNEHLIYLYINNKRGLKKASFFISLITDYSFDNIIIVKYLDYYFIVKCKKYDRRYT